MAIAFLSCENETGSDPLPPPGQAPLVLRVVAIDTTLAAPLDTLEKATFTYDNLKRITESYYVELDASGNTTYFSRLKYFYNGSDTFASKTVEFEPNDTSTKFYFFANGRLVMDSSAVDPVNNNYSTTHYTYSGNMVLVESNGYHPSIGISTSQRKVYQTFDSNGDIVHQVDSNSYSRPGSPTSLSRNEHIITYISNPNPFVKVSDPIRRPYLWDDSGLGSSKTSPRFLISQTREIYDDISPTPSHNEHTRNYTYEFRSDGLPSVARLLTNQGYHRKMLFFYE